MTKQEVETGDLLRVFNSKYFSYGVWSFRKHSYATNVEKTEEALLSTAYSKYLEVRLFNFEFIISL